MAYWYQNEITADIIKKQFEKQFSNFGLLSCTIKPKEINNSAMRFEFNIQFQHSSMGFNIETIAGCCGYAILVFPGVSAPTSEERDKLYNLLLDIVEFSARKLCIAGIMTIITSGYYNSKDSLIKILKKRAWKLVHKVRNPRYGENGNMLHHFSKNMNPYRGGKPVFKRMKKDIYA